MIKLISFILDEQNFLGIQHDVRQLHRSAQIFSIETELDILFAFLDNIIHALSNEKKALTFLILAVLWIQ